jgi:hypothetical protein
VLLHYPQSAATLMKCFTNISLQFSSILWTAQTSILQTTTLLVHSRHCKRPKIHHTPSTDGRSICMACCSA